MLRNTHRHRILAAVGFVSGLAIMATGCSSPSGDDAGTEKTLTVFAGAQTPVVANFNPFSPSPLAGTTGLVYQPLFHFNRMSSEDAKPLLGTAYEFSEDGRELTIDIRDDAKWNDGEPVTVDDVVFTFTYEVARPEALTDAVAVDEDTVKLTFSDPQFVNVVGLLGTSLILPKHIWEGNEDPTAGVNENPVGTGPYVVGEISGGSYTFTANEEYWAAPALESVRYLAIDGNQAAEDLIAAGEIDYTSIFSANYQSLVDGGMGYMVLPSDPTVLYTCANADLGCTGPQTDPAVREAIYLAIDRQTITDKAFVGLTTPMSPTLALLGRDDAWIGDGQPKEAPQTADPEAAGEVLEAAGYAKNGDGIYEKDGVPVELTMNSVDGWTDYNNAGKLIEEQAAAAGIKITAGTFSWQEFSDGRQTGQFELMLGFMKTTSLADPWQIYNDFLTTEFTAPVGEQLAPSHFNFTRYSNPIVDEAVATASATDDEAVKAEAYDAIQTEIVRDLPYIPVNMNAAQTFFNDTDFDGWPTEDNLYAYQQTGSALDMAYILQNLKPAGK
ncbi:ABC transporter substrate-binding protein [Microbacterium sp.]|uniref:ABC transporter substrate-binding protein n=1 Tax=Microbacterium sp. TaxID=51671 RepID=UPI002735E69A|nr:ABC transporter substrate-binding protein [Microbacterium sp.]MDP3949288.1 ABC transporter substrate-binding protein [Microbacterium sp.]